jgi:MFS family permease
VLGRRERSLAAIMISGMIAGISDGMTVPLIPLALEQRGIDVMVIGLYAALPWVALVVGGPFMPRFVAALGAIKAYALGLGLTALALLLFPLFDTMPGWFLLNLILGFGWAFQWIGADTWINTVVSERTRGRILALSETTWGGTAALGPLLLGLIGVEGALPFLIAASLLVIAIAPTIAGAGTVPSLDGSGVWRLDLAPVLLLPTATAGALVSGFVDSTAFALLPLYGLELGLDQATTVVMLTAISAGSSLLLLPLGWLSDRFDRQLLQLGCGMAALAGALLLPFTIGTTAVVWPLLFLWGGAVSGLYMIASILVGQYFRGEQLTSAITTMAMIYTIGSLLGPLLGGAMLAAFPPHGMMIGLGFALVAFTGLAILQRDHQMPPG